MSASPGETLTAHNIGAFFHYGPATYLGQRPWDFDPQEAGTGVYAPPGGLPDTDQWIRAARLINAGYAVLTTKHHDGFSLWPSAASSYGVQEPGADVVRAFVDSCRAQGVAPVLYYAWHDRYHEGGDSHLLPGQDRFSARYVQLVKDQLAELLTSYGEIAGVWLDVGPRNEGRINELNDFIHSISPNTAFMPNIKPYDGEGTYDVGIYEDALHGSFPNPVGEPSEWAVTIVQDGGNDWGWWQFSDLSVPSTSAEEIVACLVRGQQHNVAVNLNIPPGPNGRVPEGTIRLLEEVRTLTQGSADAARVIHPVISRSDNPLVFSGEGWDSDQQSINDSAQAGHQFGRARSFSSQIGDAVELTFAGRLDEVYFAGGPDHGFAEISLDGELLDTVNLWRSQPTGHLPWRPAVPLPASPPAASSPAASSPVGEHLLRISVADPASRGRVRGEGTTVSITGFVVRP
ncbi:alpha-L-fucosidase [Psychromicrobium xiongbiense]|uniref:alpha-L-fucosidase n=1 Tax=Psychromicrobium xiongbiense TaxID=3051184 RepID=UPI002556936B|nr:alpha-L-fucosidase [Psychromicrobium sp. YIM S02556]